MRNELRCFIIIIESKKRGKIFMYATTTAVGRLVKDPVERTYGQDGKMSLFNIAVDVAKDKTVFYDCVAFGSVAETINSYMKKGRAILVDGYFQNNNQERKTQGGETYTMYGMNLVVQRFSFLPDGQSVVSNNQGGQEQNRQSNQQSYQQPQNQSNQNNQQQGFQQQQQQPNQSNQQDNNPFQGFGKAPF